MASTRATCCSTEATSVSTSWRPSTGTDAVWREEPIDLRELAARLRSEAGFLAPVEPLTALGFGFYSHVFETASGWIVRIARVERAATRHEREARLLPLVAPHLPVAVPLPARALEPGPSAPFGGFAYRSLPGRLMTAADLTAPGWQALATDLAGALAGLHSIPTGVVAAFGAPGFEFYPFAELRQTVMPGLRARLTPAECGRVEAWWERFSTDSSLRDGTPTLTHGDPWWGNLLVSDGRLSGMIDWEFMTIADPAWDLASTGDAGNAFQRQLIDVYSAHRPLDDGAGHRMAQWWALRAFFGVRFAVDRSDEQEWVDSVRKLRAGPILG